MNDNNKVMAKKILIVLSGSIVCYLLGRYAKIYTGIDLIYIYFQYPLITIISTAVDPISGALTGLLSHLMIDKTKDAAIWWSYIFGSGIYGLCVGLLYKRFPVNKEAFKKESGSFLKQLKERFKFSGLIIFSHFIAWILIVPILNVIFYKLSLKTAFTQGAMAFISNALTSVIVSDIIIDSALSHIFRRIIAFVTLINSIIMISYVGLGTGSILLYLLTFVFCMYLFFYKLFDKKNGKHIFYIIKLTFSIALLSYLAFTVFLTIAGSLKKIDTYCQSMIVLGAGLNGEEPSEILKRRLDKAYDYYTDNNDVNIVLSGGKGNGELISEGEAMKNYLIEKGIPKEQLLTEDRSTTTEENFEYSREKLSEMGLDKDSCIIVTNNYHCYRASLYAKEAGFTNIYTLPASTPISVIIPNYLREGLAVIKYIIH